MPPHLIHDLPPKNHTAPKISHPWEKEAERRERVERMQFLANTLGVNAVIPFEDEEDIDYYFLVERMKFIANLLGVDPVIPSDYE
jgi:hypothetical protein